MLYAADQCVLERLQNRVQCVVHLLQALQFHADSSDAEGNAAMEAAVTDRMWLLEDVVALVDKWKAN